MTYLGASADADRAAGPADLSRASASSQSSIPSALTLSFAEIDAIYRAGVERGNEEAVAYDWGDVPFGKFHENLVDALYGILNRGIIFDDPEYCGYDVVKAWVENGDVARKATASAVKS